LEGCRSKGVEIVTDDSESYRPFVRNDAKEESIRKFVISQKVHGSSVEGAKLKPFPLFARRRLWRFKESG
jgi:hypothetical protein